MGIDVSVSSKNVLLWDPEYKPKDFKDYYIGHLSESFDSEQQKIKDPRITQFMYITIQSNTIFNSKQIQKLAQEIKIIKKLNILNKKDLNIIKNGIKQAIKKNLYLKFEYD